MTDPFFVVELNQLLAAGRVTLPHLAWTYATLNNRVADTAGFDNAAFTPCPTTGGGQDELRAPWTALRNRLQDVLGRSAKSFEEAGTAIIHIAAHYEAAEADAAAQVRKAWRSGAPDDALSIPADKTLPPPPPRVIMTQK
ncbi:hypothetical protein [Actinoallomurus soli]|uniref:hypothetical protein n=1 Tax=Actinoallomurus soli TaxID=2952535 RepID=UPI00209276FC|nr:hypothetical protein [Actinoallomurus soli]MCO5968978.1 hypothetical protein [Actinoallomurus soli]